METLPLFFGAMTAAIFSYTSFAQTVTITTTDASAAETPAGQAAVNVIDDFLTEATGDVRIRLEAKSEWPWPLLCPRWRFGPWKPRPIS